MTSLGLYRRAVHELRRGAYAVARRRNARRLRMLLDENSRTYYSLTHFARTQSIFVHIPKASGISINRQLYGSIGAGHMKVSEYELAFSAADFYRYFKFAFVRNPWDRLFSAYRFLKAGGMLKIDRAWADKHLAPYPDFRSFVLDGLQREDIAAHMHFVPQHRFLASFDHSGYPIDFLGFFENLDEDYALIVRRLGHGEALEHHNRTAGEQRDYRDAYDPAMIARVAEVYREDIRLFGYEFDGSGLKRQLADRDAGRLLV
jgi:hypothetical protein